jgi:hypothetical protein
LAVKFAVVGSRTGIPAGRTAEIVHKLTPSAVGLISGGAPGVDREAEETAISLGLPVLSLRPHRFDLENYGVERWLLGVEQPRKEVLHAEPTWHDFRGAAWYRNLLIAEEADEVVAIWDGRSRGTKDTIEAARAEGKPLHIWREDRMEWV